VFSVRGPCRDDETGMGIVLSSEVPREQQCGQKMNYET
jgi:hypothetical protein